MTDSKLEAEIKKLNELKEKMESAKSSWKGWMERDLERPDGSFAQDQRFERHLQAVEGDFYAAQSAYETQQAKVAQLQNGK